MSGALPSDRATHERSPSVSAVPVGIPSADDWVVIAYRSHEGWSTHHYGQVSTISPKTLMVKVGAGRRLSRVYRDDVIVVSDIEAARLLISKLDGAYGELQRRKYAALDAYKSAIGKLYTQAIEARRAETGTGSVHESTVAEGHAPNTSPTQSPNTQVKP